MFIDSSYQRSVGAKYMFLARVCLGRFFKATKPLSLNRPPCVHVCAPGNTCRHKRYDSVVGDMAGKNAREFVIYDSNLGYPEYLIKYERRDY